MNVDIPPGCCNNCVVFLDVDGVLTTSDALLENYEPGDPSYYFVTDLCPDNYPHITPLSKLPIANLKWICDQIPSVKIVLSSTWREDEDYRSFLEAAMKAGGIDTELVMIGATPSLKGSSLDGRGAEIRTWLVLHPEYGNRFAIIDDGHRDNFIRHELGPNFVQTVMKDMVHRDHEGLTRIAAGEVVNILLHAMHSDSNTDAVEPMQVLG